MDVFEFEMKQTASPPRTAFFYGVEGTPFIDAAEAWWWTLDCLEARAGGSRGCSALKVGRPCEPDDVVNALRRLDLPKVHARTVMAWGKRRTRPPDDSDALRLWNEVMDRLTRVLQAKGIVGTPAPSEFELVDMLATGCGVAGGEAAMTPAPDLDAGTIVGTGGFRFSATRPVSYPAGEIVADDDFPLPAARGRG